MSSASTGIGDSHKVVTKDHLLTNPERTTCILSPTSLVAKWLWKRRARDLVPLLFSPLLFSVPVPPPAP